METRYRVTNKCRYSIGVQLPTGQNIAIAPNSFQLLTMDDIVYIESICPMTKPFAKRMLVVYDNSGKEVNLNEMGTYIEEDPVPHYSDDEIAEMLKQSPKKVEAWLNAIEDPAELHAILEVSKTMELTSSKLKLLAEKMPEQDVI